MTPLSPIHPSKQPVSNTKPSLRFGETDKQDTGAATGEYVEQAGGVSVLEMKQAGVDPLVAVGGTRVFTTVPGGGLSASLGDGNFVLNLGGENGGSGSQSLPKIVLPKRLASSDSPGLSASHQFPRPSGLKPVLDEFRRAGGGSTSMQLQRQANVTTSVGRLKVPAPADATPDPENKLPPGTVDHIPLPTKDQGTVDYVPLPSHEHPTGEYIPAVNTLDFNPITADYMSDQMHAVIFGPNKLSVPEITKYVVNHPEFEKRLRDPMLKVIRYEDRTPVYSNQPETDAIDLIKLSDDDVAFVKAFFTLDEDIANTNARPKRQTSAYLDLIRQTDIARFKRETVDEYYQETPEDKAMKPDEEAMRKRFVLMKAYRALGQRFTSIFDNTLSSDLSFDSMFPPGMKSRLGMSDDVLHVPLEVDENSLSGAALFTKDEIDAYREKEVPPMTSTEQLALAEIRREMRRGQRTTMLALAASVFLAVGGLVTAGYYALRPAASNENTQAAAGLDRPDLGRPIDDLRPPKVEPQFDPNAPKADDVLIDPAQFKELDKLGAAFDLPMLIMEREVRGGQPVFINRDSLHPNVPEEHRKLALNVVLKGNGSGHIIDLTDMPSQSVTLHRFGPGEVEIRGATITVLDLCSNTRVYSKSGPHYGVLIPMKTVVNMKSTEFEGTYVMSSGPAEFEIQRASTAEIAALKNDKLTQKIIVRYPGKSDDIIVFTYPGARAINGAKAFEQAPDLSSFMRQDRERYKTKYVSESQFTQNSDESK